MPTDLMPPLDDEPELRPSGNGHGGGQMTPIQTQLGDVVSMRRAAVMMPRQPAEVRRQIAEAAEMFGEGWEYRFPVKNRRTGQTEFIEGPTIGCTMAVARAYGNCDVAHTRTEDEGNSWVLYSTFLDYQSGFSLTRGFRQRKAQVTMGGDRDRGEDIAFQIGVSKSTRNVVARALSDFVEYARQRARDRLSGAIAKRPDEYRERIKAYLGEINYRLPAIEGAVGARIDKWTPEQLAATVRILSAHKDGVLRDLSEVYEPRGADAVEARPQEPARTAPEPARTPEPSEAAAPSDEPPDEPATPAPQSRRRGRPTHEEITRGIIEEIYAAASPGEVDHVMRDYNSRIERLPDELRSEIRAAYQSRLAERDIIHSEPSARGDDADEAPADPAEAWLAAARKDIAGMPALGHIRAYRNRYLNDATVYGEDAVAEVERLLDEQEAKLKGPGA